MTPLPTASPLQPRISTPGLPHTHNSSTDHFTACLQVSAHIGTLVYLLPASLPSPSPGTHRWRTQTGYLYRQKSSLTISALPKLLQGLYTQALSKGMPAHELWGLPQQSIFSCKLMKYSFLKKKLKTLQKEGARNLIHIKPLESALESCPSLQMWLHCSTLLSGSES